jgi:hypothetical protein
MRVSQPLSSGPPGVVGYDESRAGGKRRRCNQSPVATLQFIGITIKNIPTWNSWDVLMT